MSNQNWQMKTLTEDGKTFFVKLNVEMVAVLDESGLVLKMKDDYPWVVRPATWCASCGPPTCAHGRREKFLKPLHIFVWLQKHGAIKPMANGRAQVIHHKNEDKCDARLKNLAIGTQSAHAKHHNSKRRRHGVRTKENLFGWYRPHQPAPVVGVAEDVKKSIAPPNKTPRPKTLNERIFEFEKLLEANFEDVMAETEHLDEAGRSIPRSASAGEWRKPETRLLGLRMPRMACSKAEACFVRLYADFGLDLESVAEYVGEPVELLRHLLKRVPVAVAVERWVKYRRLPTKTVKFGFRI